LIVDTLGLLLAVSISAASAQDRDAADDAVTSSMGKYPSLNTLFVDSAYAGKWAQRRSTLICLTFKSFEGQTIDALGNGIQSKAIYSRQHPPPAALW
jgi:hypothetical protein